MSPLLKNLIIALGTVLVLGAVYFMMPQGEENPAGISPESDAVRKSARILADTTKINQLKIGGTFFSDVRFLSLKELSIDAELTDVGTGRENPFEAVP